MTCPLRKQKQNETPKPKRKKLCELGREYRELMNTTPAKLITSIFVASTTIQKMATQFEMAKVLQLNQPQTESEKTQMTEYFKKMPGRPRNKRKYSLKVEKWKGRFHTVARSKLA